VGKGGTAKEPWRALHACEKGGRTSVGGAATEGDSGSARGCSTRLGETKLAVMHGAQNVVSACLVCKAKRATGRAPACQMAALSSPRAQRLGGATVRSISQALNARGAMGALVDGIAQR